MCYIVVTWPYYVASVFKFGNHIEKSVKCLQIMWIKWTEAFNNICSVLHCDNTIFHVVCSGVVHAIQNRPEGALTFIFGQIKSQKLNSENVGQ